MLKFHNVTSEYELFLDGTILSLSYMMAFLTNAWVKQHLPFVKVKAMLLIHHDIFSCWFHPEWEISNPWQQKTLLIWRTVPIFAECCIWTNYVTCDIVPLLSFVNVQWKCELHMKKNTLLLKNTSQVRDFYDVLRSVNASE